MTGWIILAAVVLSYFTVSFLIVGNYFYNMAISATTKKNFEDPAPDNGIGFYENAGMKRARKLADLEFRSQVETAIVDIQSHDGLKLRAYRYFLPEDKEPSRKWAVVVHGYDSSAKDMITYIRGFHEMGYSVLAPDLRGHGESGGKYIGMGWMDRLDVIMWVETIINEYPDAEIAMFGVSMGAATVMMAAGENLPPNVKVIIEDCGYTSVHEIMAHQLKRMFGLSGFPFLQAASIVMRVRAGYGMFSGSAVDAVTASNKPILFIHGKEDAFVPFWMLAPLYKACGTEKGRLVVTKARHAESVLMEPEKYWGSVRDFCGRFI